MEATEQEVGGYLLLRTVGILNGVWRWKRMMRWKRRWCMLDPDSGALRMFRAGERPPGHDPRRVLNLKDYAVHRVSPKEQLEAGRRHAIRLDLLASVKEGTKRSTWRRNKARWSKVVLAAASEADREAWLQSLSKCAGDSDAYEAYETSPLVANLRRKFARADRSGDGLLQLHEIRRLTRDMGLDVDVAELERRFREADADGNGALDFREFFALAHGAYTNAAVDRIIRGVVMAGDQTQAADILRVDAFLAPVDRERRARNLAEKKLYKIVITAEELVSFFRGTQGEAEFSLEDALGLMSRFSSDSGLGLGSGQHEQEGSAAAADAESVKGLLDGFSFWFLLRDDAVCGIERGAGENLQWGASSATLTAASATIMQRPLSEYFVASSHNTYLTGDQVGPSSRVAQYRKVLSEGCRCLELDTWDGDGGEPVIYHGYTASSLRPFRLKFRDVVRAIRECAFLKSPYPVILSLENHCSLEQQDAMARIFREELGDALHCPREGGGAEDEVLLSPKALRYKILLKGKRTGTAPSAPTPAAQGGSPKVAKSLSDITYLAAVPFDGHAALGAAPVPECTSFTEDKARKLASKSEDFVIHNASRLSRVYPSGKRLDSSNYNPVPLWRAGCQLVALNYQTPGKAMWINAGMFSGERGYVLKPPSMRPLDASAKCAKAFPACQVHIQVMCGFEIPKSRKTSAKDIVDPFVTLTVGGPKGMLAGHRTSGAGPPNDKGAIHCKTHAVQNNGFNPQWGESWTWTVPDPEFSFVLIQLFDERERGSGKGDWLAQRVVRISRLKTGFRVASMLDRHGETLRSGGGIRPGLILKVDVTPIEGAPEFPPEDLQAYGDDEFAR